MAKAFSVASWNVEHFRSKPERAVKVINFLKKQKPDVFALYEVEGKHINTPLFKNMPGYSFHITEGRQVQEILIGVKRRYTVYFRQKLEFKSGIHALRPGADLALRTKGKDYSLLFLHTKSGSNPRGLGLRDDMHQRACKFRKVLDKRASGQGKANYIFMGDLNLMGMKYGFKKDIDAPTELAKLDKMAGKSKMKRLSKDELFTWWNGSMSKYPKSDLEQVFASEHLKFRLFGRGSNKSEVTVRGWPKEGTVTRQDAWIAQYSEHGLLFFQVESV